MNKLVDNLETKGVWPVAQKNLLLTYKNVYKNDLPHLEIHALK